MVVEDDLIGLRQRCLCRLNLLDQVNAVAVFFDHRDDAVDVPGHTLEAVDKGGFLILFHSPPHNPSPVGWVYTEYSTFWISVNSQSHRQHYCDDFDTQSPIPLRGKLPSDP